MAMPRILALLGIPVDFPLEAAGYFDPALVLTNLFKPFSSSERNPLDAEAVDVLRPPPYVPCIRRYISLFRSALAPLMNAALSLRISYISLWLDRA